jgi:hypothetical protein
MNVEDSTRTLHLHSEAHREKVPNLGSGSHAGIYSPAVVIFNDDLDYDCVDLPVCQRETVVLLIVTAPRVPKDLDGRLSKVSDVRDLNEKIKLVYRVVGHKGKEVLVLGVCQSLGCVLGLVDDLRSGAMGCGLHGYHCR